MHGGEVGFRPVKLKVAQALAAWALLLGLAAIFNPASAQDQVQQTAAERCFEHHKFGAQPVDVAKTAEGDTVIAQVSWGYHDTIGCYLTLDDAALAVLRAAPLPQSLPDARTTTSLRCFAHHRFGAEPVDVAKTDDGRTVLARLSWGYHESIGCFLVLDNTALATLRAVHTDTESNTDTTDADPAKAGPQFTPIATSSHSCAIRADQTIACWGGNYRDGQIDAPPGQYTAIAVSSSHSCAIRTDQTIECWGNNRDGQADSPTGQYTAIAINYPYSCAIRTDQTIECWGNNRDGRTDSPTGQYTAIAAGSRHSCAIRTDQTIECWGNSGGRRTDSPPGQYTAIAVSYHSCAIRTDQTIECWGSNGHGQADAPPGQYIAITAGSRHSCAIRTDQTIECWGDNGYGQIETPPGHFTAIAAGLRHSCAIRTDQTIECWGDNQDGQTSLPTSLTTPLDELLLVESFSRSEAAVEAGRSFDVTVEFNRAVSGFNADDINVVNGDITRFSGSGSEYEATVTAAALGTVVVLIPRAAAFDQDGRSNEPSQPLARTVRTTTATATAIANGGFHSCDIRADQAIVCWGYNTYGQTNAPPGQYTAIAAGYTHSCAIRTDQTIDCWGSNRSGEANAPPGHHTAIAAGNSYSCAIRTDQTIDCWGYRRTGLANVPVGHFTYIAAGETHSCAIRTDQTIDCWGSNQYGQTDAPPGQFIAIAAGETHSCAIRTDQTIDCWGNDDWQGNPVGQADQPPGQFIAIAAGETHSCAIRTDQTIDCWGSNQYGQTDAVPGQFIAIAAGETHSCAIRTDQTIDCWGFNRTGQIDVPQSQFTMVTPSGYSFGSHTCGIRADQTIDCWTRGGNGQTDASSGVFAAITPNDEFFDIWDRKAVRTFAFAEFHRQEPDHGWTGDIQSCVAGTTGQEYRDSIFQRINWYRKMAGVDPVVENPEYSTLAQHAALIMAANGWTSHHPPDDWACWTQLGYQGASKSNLASLGGGGITNIHDGYMRDPGPDNIAVGHRRWILNPNAVEFGTGDIPPGGSNALYVVPELRVGSNRTREERGFVAWPPPGYVPPAVNWGRWSFDLSDAHYPADFSTASVEVSDEFGPLEVEIIYRHSSGIVWAVNGDTNSYLLSGRRPWYSLADSNHCYTVTIGGVKVGDSIQTPYEYAVCILARGHH